MIGNEEGLEISEVMFMNYMPNPSIKVFPRVSKKYLVPSMGFTHFEEIFEILMKLYTILVNFGAHFKSSGLANFSYLKIWGHKFIYN